MTHHTPSPSPHPILPYAEALEKEHEEALVGSSVRPIVDLLAEHSSVSPLSGRVVVVRRAGPTLPFGEHRMGHP